MLFSALLREPDWFGLLIGKDCIAIVGVIPVVLFTAAANHPDRERYDLLLVEIEA